MARNPKAAKRHMLDKTAQSAVPIALGIMLSLGMCRPKDLGESSDKQNQLHERKQQRTPRNDAQHLSDFQTKRIRSTIEAVVHAGASGSNQSAIQSFKELLDSYSSDMLFLNGLVLEASETSTETQVALASALVQLYCEQDTIDLSELLDAMQCDGVNAGIMVQLFSDELYKNKDDVVRAFEELIVKPSRTIEPYNYARIADGAANVLGYAEALARIPDINDGWFGTAAANKIVVSWTLVNPVASSSYVRDLPESSYRDTLIVHMVEEIATGEDFEMASAWAGYLNGNARELAFEIVERQETIVRSRNEGRAERVEQESNENR
jgi:hypothetical protein